MKTTTDNKMMVMLQYRINRHQAMGNGSKCQELISQLKKLESTANAARR